MTDLLNPEMPADQLRLHMGEMTPDEINITRAAIRWANTEAQAQADKVRRQHIHNARVAEHRLSVEFLHSYAKEMSDPSARAILNVAANAWGRSRLRALTDAAKEPSHFPGAGNMIAKPAGDHFPDAKEMVEAAKGDRA